MGLTFMLNIGQGRDAYVGALVARGWMEGAHFGAVSRLCQLVGFLLLAVCASVFLSGGGG